MVAVQRSNKHNPLQTGRAGDLLRSRRSAFTVIELLIVVATMATIAGMVIPQIESAVNDAKRSATLENLHGLTIAIERFKLNHFGVPPNNLSGNSLSQLVSTTDASGTIGQGAEFPFGPYIINEVPENPLTGSATVAAALQVPPEPMSPTIGWIYDTKSGQIWANESGGADG